MRLLQRHHDGELGESEREHVDRLLRDSEEARELLEALEELEHAARGAERAIWEGAEPHSPETLVATARQASPPVEDELAELAPMLERVHDAEALDAEREAADELRDARGDAAAYLDELEGLGRAVRAAHEEAVEGQDFSGFFDEISARLDAESEDTGDSPSGAVPDYERDEHIVLLQRFHDAEVDERERRIVEAWIDEEHDEVLETLSALDEISLATRAASELACERAHIDELWTGISETLDLREQGADNVMSLDDFRARAEEAEAAEGAEEDSEGVLARYSQALLGAAAAAVIIGLGASLLSNPFGPQERVVVREKTVVIVDDVQQSKGTLVTVASPIERASAEGPSIEADDEETQQEEARPTVIWMIDEGTDGAEPSEGTPDEEKPDREETEAGDGDFSGQPI
jgi:hypothetical protein